MNIRPTILTTIFLLNMPGTVTLAHHSVASSFDASKVTTITGVISRIEWMNPHVWVFMNVKGVDGRVVAWHVQLAALGALDKAGFEKSFLDLTSSFTIEIWPALEESPNYKMGNGRLLTLPDGRTFDVSDKWPDAKTAR